MLLNGREQSSAGETLSPEQKTASAQVLEPTFAGRRLGDNGEPRRRSDPLLL